MRDLLPADMARFRQVEGVFRDACLKWGYQEIRTPLLEYLHLFTATGTLTPQLLNRVYSFLDWDGWGGERVVLRPDGTIPAARLFIGEMAGRSPARLFYVQNVFSFEETGQEARERWQGGVELMGGHPPQADAELVMLGREILHRLGLSGVEVKLAHLGLLGSLVRELGLEEEAVDRLRNGEGQIAQHIGASRPELRDALSLLFEARGQGPGFLSNVHSLLTPLLPSLTAELEEFTALARLLTELGCEYTIDMTLSRGFEYYTGAVFHFYCQGVRVGGGGRYDNLIPLLGGSQVPASGFALYLDRVMARLEPPPAPARISIEVAGPGLWKPAFDLAGALRRAGFTAELALGGAGDPAITVETGPSFVLRWRGRARRLASATEVVQALGEEGHAEVSPA